MDGKSEDDKQNDRRQLLDNLKDMDHIEENIDMEGNRPSSSQNNGHTGRTALDPQSTASGGGISHRMAPVSPVDDSGRKGEGFPRSINNMHPDKNEAEGPEDNGGNPHVLDPDNPLMMKFQKALTELLQKRLSKLDQEVLELVNYAFSLFTFYEMASRKKIIRKVWP